MSEEIKNYVYKTDETALEALAERNADLETAIQFAAGEGISQEDLAANAAGEGFGVQISVDPEYANDTTYSSDIPDGPSAAYLDARLTLLEQAQTEFQERVAKTFKEAGFKF